MEKYNIVISEEAASDFSDAILYIARNSKKSANDMYDKIFEVLKTLEKFPKMGRLIPDKKMAERGYRMIAIESYLLFYFEKGRDINVLRFIHAARNYPRLFSAGIKG